MPSGKIGLAYDYLSPEHQKILDNVMYEIVGIEKENVVSYDNNPDVIICIGEKMLNDLCGLKGILKFAGTIQTMGKIPIVPIVSPGYLEHNPNYIRKFAEDIQLAYQVSIGLDRVDVTNQYVLVHNIEQIEQLVKYCQETGICSFDFETTELTDLGTFDPDFQCNTLSISFQQGSSYVIPLLHPESPFIGCELEYIPILLKIFNDPNIIKVGHNIKFDMHCAAWLGIKEFRGVYHDTMLMHHLIYQIASHKLKDVVREYFPRFANYEQVVGKNWNKVSLEVLAKYNALDSDLTLRLYWVFIDMLMEDPAIYIEYRNLIAPATKVLFQMEENGMLIDKAYLVEAIRKVEEMIIEQEGLMDSHPEVERFNLYKKEVAKENYIKLLQEKHDKESLHEFKGKKAQENQKERIVRYENEIKELKSGETDVECEPINFNSPDQLQELLFTRAGFGFVLPKASFGLAIDSTGKDNLDLIKDKSGFIEELKAYRQLKKTHNTYLVSILNKIDRAHYIHTSFKQHGTITGRLCIEANQLIQIVGGSKPIKDIKIGDLVYCYDNENKLRIRKVLNTWNKGLHPIVDIEWKSSGNKHNITDFGHLKCTPDHYIKTFKGWVSAFELKKNDRLFHVARRNHIEGGSIRPRLYYSIGRMQKEQNVIKQELFNCFDPKIVIHHKDFDSSNNYLYNVELMKIGQHTSIHTKILIKQGKIKWDHLKNYTPIRVKGKNNPLYIHRTRYQLLKMLYKAGGRPTYVNMDFTAFKEKCILFNINIAEVSKRFNRSGIYISRGSLKKSFEYSTHKKLKLGYYRAKELYEYYSITNHRVMQITQAGVAEVYDIEIEEFNNFIASEICVHNSSEKPNLQNIITRTKYKQVEEAISFVKRSFIPPDGYTFVAADYSQIELRVIAHYAQEKTMIEAYKNNQDLHELTAANDRGYTLEELRKLDPKIYKQYRFEAKASNFGFCFGISALGFQEYVRTEYGMTISLREAEKRRDSFFKKYPTLLEYHRLYINKARKYKYVRTFFGRKVHLPDIDSLNNFKKGHAERNSINSPIQGTAGELTIFSLVLLSHRLPEEILMVNDVHDAIYFYIPDNILDQYLPLIRETMEQPLLQEYFGKTIDSVPIKVEFETSKKSWKDLKELK